MNRTALTLALGFLSLGGVTSARGEDAPLPLPIPPAPTPDALPTVFTPATDQPSTHAPAAVPAVPSAPITTVAPAMPMAVGGGQTGSINVPRLHIRSGPNAEQFEIITTAAKDTPVVIYGESNGWYNIGYPSDGSCYVKASAIQGEAPATIPETGVALPVSGTNPQIHVRPWAQSTVVGSLTPGSTVTVLGRGGRGVDEFFRIVPPAEARAWVKAEYVSRGDQASLPSASAPQPGNIGPSSSSSSGSSSSSAAKKEPVSSKKAPPAETVDKGSVLAEAMKRMQADIARKQAELDKQHEDYVASVEQQLAAIDNETAARKKDLEGDINRSLTAAEAARMITGWVEFTGRGLKRPAAYRLVKGGRVLFLLRSSSIDLDKYVNQMVAVDGSIELAPGWEANILDVNTVNLLDSGPLPRDEADQERFSPRPASNPPVTPVQGIEKAPEPRKALSSQKRPAPTMEEAPVADDAGTVEVLPAGKAAAIMGGATAVEEAGTDAGPVEELTAPMDDSGGSVEEITQ